MDVKEVIHFCSDGVLATLTWFSQSYVLKFLDIKPQRFKANYRHY